MRLNKLIVLTGLAALSLVVGCNSNSKKSVEANEDTLEALEAETAEVPKLNALSQKEASDGWILMFDGKTSDGWHGYAKETFPAAWEIVDGELHIQGSGRGEAGAEEGGDILYNKKFSNFHFTFEWKFAEGANSGIFYLGQESDDYDFIWKTAPEYQILDNERHIDAGLGKDGNRQSASLYDIYPAKPQNSNPAGEWNTGEIMVYNGTVIHKQNGETVVEYHLWTPKWYEDVAVSKFPGLNENWAEVAKEGFVGLQDHGDDVWFRNLKIKEL